MRVFLILNFYGKAEWKLIKPELFMNNSDKKGIEIYKEKGNGPEYVEIKGINEVRSNLKTFIALMKDVNKILEIK
ncbi:MAG: hypothetical protein K9H65_02535 [Bacteroidales bacterium]|nr:hypothetical protein [Bacteroidales bacterium]